MIEFTTVNLQQANVMIFLNNLNSPIFRRRINN